MNMTESAGAPHLAGGTVTMIEIETENAIVEIGTGIAIEIVHEAVTNVIVLVAATTVIVLVSVSEIVVPAVAAGMTWERCLRAQLPS